LPCGVLTTSFKIARGMSRNLIHSGVTQVREFAEPRWVASFTYAPMKRAGFQDIEAWVDSLRGGLMDFYAHHPLRPFPVSYPFFPALGWNGIANVTSIGVNTIGVAGMLANFTLKPGDMIGLIEGARRGLFRVIEPHVGASGLLTIEPRIVPGVFTGATICNVARPVCVMTIDVDSISGEQTAGQAAPFGFSAVQKVY